MSPYLQAAILYSNAGDVETRYTWNEVITYHLHYAHVLSTPTGFLLARPVISTLTDTHGTLDPLHSPTSSDCWHIWAAAGNLPELLSQARLHPLPFVSWNRRQKFRIYSLDVVLARHDKNTQSPRSSTATTATG